MKNIRKITAIVLCAVLVLSFAACGKKDPTSTATPATPTPTDSPKTPVTFDREIAVYTLAGPTGIGMTKLMDDNNNKKTALKYTFDIASAPDQIAAKVIQGSFDIAAVPVNLASVLFKKTGGKIYVAGVNTLGVLYILENGSTINSISDLKGKTLYATGQGATPEYILKYLLKKNGIDPASDITVEYIAQHAELATKMSSGDVKLGMLPEPNVTSAMIGNKDLRIALDLTAEWKKVSDTELCQGVIIVNKEFADANPEVVKKFFEEYKASVDFVKANVEEAAALCESVGIIPKAALAKKAIPNCNLTLATGNEMKSMVSGMLNVLFEADPSSVGGELPADSFYLIYE